MNLEIKVQSYTYTIILQDKIIISIFYNKIVKNNYDFEIFNEFNMLYQVRGPTIKIQLQKKN